MPNKMKNLRRYHITSHIQGKAFVYKGFPYVPTIPGLTKYNIVDGTDNIVDGADNIIYTGD